MQRMTNSYIAVNRYEHHGSYWSWSNNISKINIQSTHEVTEEPAAVYEHNWKEHVEAHEEIRESQRENEEVGGAVEVPGEEDQQEFILLIII